MVAAAGALAAKGDLARQFTEELAALQEAFGSEFEVCAGCEGDAGGRADHRVESHHRTAATRTSQGDAHIQVRAIGPGRSRVQVALPSPDGRELHAEAIIDSGDTMLIARLAGLARTNWEQARLIRRQQAHIGEHVREVSRTYEEVVWLRQLARQIEGQIVQPLDAIAERVFPDLREVVGAELLSVQLLDPRQTVAGRDEGRTRRYGDLSFEESTINAIVSAVGGDSRRTIVLNADRVPALVRDRGIRTAVVVPIHTSREPIGRIVAVNRADGHEFGTVEAELITSAASFLASHAENYALYREVEQLLVGVVRTMTHALDARDPYTCGHSDRVAAMSASIAASLSLPERECERIYLTGLVHDLGKIGVPDAVLNKPGKLTPEEFELIKAHPVIGYNMLKDLTPLSYVLPGVLHHHESFDGRGYPHGLAGQAIPLVARIVAVADSFDAMTSSRPYRQGMSFEQAERILTEGSGRQWDAEIVTAFLRIREDAHAVCTSRVTLENVLQGGLAVSTGLSDRISRAVGRSNPS